MAPGPLWMHNHVSEREVAHRWPDGRWDDGSWEDCLWCSVVEWLNDTYKDVPDTLAYAEKIRAASGEPTTGGSNFGNVQTAFNRLGIDIDLDPVPFATFAKWRLKPGTAGVVNGAMGNFPRGHRLRRWDTDFVGGHAVYVARPYSTTAIWWCDPLATDSGYLGEWITLSELKVFMGTSWEGVAAPLRQKVVTPPPPPPAGADMPALVTYTPGSTANIKPASNVRAAPAATATKFRTTGTAKEPVVLTGTVKGSVDPANGSDVWYVWWKNGRWEYTAKDNVLDIKAPAAAPTYPDVRPQLAEATATITAQTATIAELKTEAAEALALKEALARFTAE